MSDPQRPLGDRLRQAGERIGSQIEEELRRTVRYIDDEVVPEVRRNGSAALRTAADKLRELAEQMDDERRRREGDRS
jgi:hypothetical protein